MEKGGICVNAALIVSATDAEREKIAQLLHRAGFDRIVSVERGSQAKYRMEEHEFSLVIIDTPLPDEFGDQTAMQAICDPAAGVILTVHSEIAEQVSAAVEDAGIFVLPKPLDPQLFYQCLKLMAVAQKRMAWLQQENHQLQRRIEDLRLIDRAKCVLIQYLSMSETEAHRYIEKQAMNLRVPRTDIARGILKIYEQPMDGK